MAHLQTPALTGNLPALAPVTARAAPREGQRLDTLQALRAIAAIDVVLFHCQWTHIASFGVELFFVISGFVICHAAALDPSQFLRKRIVRVVPLYWLATLGIFLLALVAPSLVPSTRADGFDLFRSLAFIPYQRPDGTAMPVLFLGWTLNYEAFFYLAYAGCLAVSTRRAPWLMLGFIVAAVLAHPLLAPLAFPLDFWSRPLMLNFAAGVAAWLVWRRLGDRLYRTPPLLVAASAAAAFVLFAVGAHQQPGSPVPWAGLIGTVLTLSLLALSDHLKWPAWLLLVGDASYSLYLLHPFVLEAVNRLIHPFGTDPMGLLATAAAFAVAISLALASFYLIERPSNRTLRRKLAEMQRRAPA